MKFAIPIITTLLISALMKYLMSSSNRETSEKVEGNLLLKMNKAYGVIGIIGIVLAAIAGIAGGFVIVKTFQDFLMLLLAEIIMIFLCLILVLAARNYKIIVSDEKILFYSITGKSKEILWTNIEKVKFNKATLELKLSTNSTSIKLHMHLVGFNRFLQLMKKFVNIKIYSSAIAAIGSVQKRYS